MASTTQLPAMDNTMGALFIGVILAMGLWGAGTVQAYYYYDRFHKDQRWLKIIVGLVWILDTIHQALISHTVYTYLVTFYAQPAELNIVVWSLMIEVAFSAFVVLFVQGFFLLRIWKLSHHNYIMVGFCTALVLANILCSLIYTVKSQQIGDTYTDLKRLATLSKLVNATGGASDLCIAACLIYLLQTSRTGFRRSDNIINRLILFSLSTGLLTSLDAITSLIMISVFPNNFIYIGFYLCNCKLYTNSLMSALNSRYSNKGGYEFEGESSRQDLSDTGRGFRSRAVEVDAPSMSKGFGTNQHTLSIKVATETVQDIDGGDSTLKHTPSEDIDVYHYKS